MSRVSKFTETVDREMRKFPSSRRGMELLQNYYRTKLDLLGLSLPTQRGRLATGYAELHGKSWDEQAVIWFRVWNESKLMESMSQAIFFFEEWAHERTKLKRKHLRSQKSDEFFAFDPLWPYLVKMVDCCENWVHSDGLSGLLSAAVEERPVERYKTLETWNRSKNPWFRRQSLVSLHFYSRMRKQPFVSTKTLPLIEACLDDEHFYVQRAVGWALRECYNVDSKTTLPFLKKHIHRIAPIGYYAATEKLSSEEKARLKALRQKTRVSKTKRRALAKK